MGYESKEDLEIRLAKVDVALDKARKSVQTDAADTSVRRNYEMLLQERKELIAELSSIQQIEGSTYSGRTYARTGRSL